MKWRMIESYVLEKLSNKWGSNFFIKKLKIFVAFPITKLDGDSKPMFLSSNWAVIFHIIARKSNCFLYLYNLIRYTT